jgi:hypothetical protein
VPPVRKTRMRRPRKSETRRAMLSGFPDLLRPDGHKLF